MKFDAGFQVIDPPAPNMGLRMKPVLRAREVAIEDLPGRVENLFLLKFEPGVSDLDKMAFHASLGTTSVGEMAPDRPEVVFIPPGADLNSVILQALADPQVAWAATETFGTFAAVSPNPRPVFGANPDDPSFDNQHYLLNDGRGTRREGADIHVARPDEAWDLQIGRMGVIVAVVDSGILIDHPELYLNMFLNEGELPDPECRTGGIRSLDIDGDGFVTFRDLREASATELSDCGVSDTSGLPGAIDCRDLIDNLSDGVDNDGSRVVDDFCGADLSDVSRLGRVGCTDPAAVSITGCFDPTRATNDPTDLYGHGLALSGIIGSETDNDLLLSGIAWNVQILPVKVTAVGENPGRTANVYGMHYAALMGAHVIMLAQQLLPSQEGFDILTPQDRDEMLAGFRAAYLEADWFGVDLESALLVMSAGQWKLDCDDLETLCSDARLLAFEPNVIVVGGTNWNDRIWNISNFGLTSVHIGAPAAAMRLLDLEGGLNLYELGGGTSAAGAMVAGGAALVVAHDPVLITNPDPVLVRSALLDGADQNVRNLDRFWQDGRRLNVTGALGEL